MFEEEIEKKIEEFIFWLDSQKKNRSFTMSVENLSVSKSLECEMEKCNTLIKVIKESTSESSFLFEKPKGSNFLVIIRNLDSKWNEVSNVSYYNAVIKIQDRLVETAEKRLQKFKKTLGACGVVLSKE